ncbi:helix-turn-helix domain-containing protein [Lysinibacillus pakistanensis]|uniref:Helix-turn-helix transcriptional regulator n=1 Tax=Lysinibacillus pakistanensis TaxID=759811 RepID=A0AAX3WUG5_9BACI|nr:helix-turn-helix transcriptional regulator [Lysinibacillus pakistanensis]MDM5229665.1 helix-turn-helix transcriptional regulator [Lysinibacillus pakistanensis]WHY45237.1 helix-turn-helix transcriptional regulator [Lysinibacillus pakistanensis]WHY50246.1 helix-turn-helix transcriptional regulator [Lysinibacillus pakistanensis]
MELYIKLKEVLAERGITQKQLAEQSGIRANAISEMVNNQRQTINKDQLAKVCEVLGIERVEDMLEFRK